MSSFATAGPGFETYSTLLSALGRQYVRREVRLTLEAAFAERNRAEPRRSFILGETGFRTGGKLWPHKSHQKGTSVDVFLPLQSTQGAPASLTHQPWTLWVIASTSTPLVVTPGLVGKLHP